MRALIIALLLHLLAGCASAPVQASAPASAPASVIAPSRSAEPVPDDVVTVIPLQHAMAEQMAKDVRNLLSSKYGCRLVPNPGSNTIVAVGTRDEIAKVKELVASLDTPPVAGR
jgi:type II secretory pathway component GspD/PulD (secretin)